MFTKPETWFGFMLASGFLSVLFIILYKPIVKRLFSLLILRMEKDQTWELFRQSHGNIAQQEPHKKTLTVISPWENLRFNPVYLHRLPLWRPQEVGTDVTIGSDALRPLSLRTPILIGGMGYGTALTSRAKQALALGATKAGTAANTGSGPYLPEERAAAEKLVVQYTRGEWERGQECYTMADAVEIQFGEGNSGAAPVTVPWSKLATDPFLRMSAGYKRGIKIDPRFKGIETSNDLAGLVNKLRKSCKGVPIGVKLGATQWLEQELDQILRSEVDFISIDGAEGGGMFSTMSVDGIGIPTLHALVRARRFIDSVETERRVSLLVGGGLSTPSSILKALALGADAVFIGTVAIMALTHSQTAKLMPWESPFELVCTGGNREDKLDPHASAESLYAFLRQSLYQMQTIALTIGRSHLQDVSVLDLCSVDQQVSEWLGVSWTGYPSSMNQPNHTKYKICEKSEENIWENVM
jgi:glutamate synthase domain-containing protein 2